MGLFDDILKGLPANAVLREQITQLNAQKAAAETENAILKDDLRQAKSEIAQLKKQIKEFAHDDSNLDDLEVRVLSALADPETEPYASSLPSTLQVHRERLNYALQRLAELEFVRRATVWIDEPSYSLTQKGRSYLIQNNLI